MEQELGVPVVATAARQGKGINDLREKVCQVVQGLSQNRPRQVRYSQEIEATLENLLPKIEGLGLGKFLNPRWVALRFWMAIKN